ncbi:hybrid sensor histidine kinase/response regulator [Isachenkonia alkalipeptolytica]|uniref:Stage 0 sporulation protein A homolog n=1 Tax=Isachenkonia alkalipeptolytica TaxID=2565777 RepID=A0AA43XJJ1_9CLOT|nr:hybrid sensor histidine kinase/response regulator [Isachenkonia alkalipeptolytica]NBG87469.1 response regulator [Isachenkonia alkalipeptolytica]
MEEKKGKILIVDDVAQNIQLIANFLKEDYELAFALHGKEAVHQALQNSFDLVLLDIMMPEVDGFKVCEVLKNEEKTKEVPVIFLTAKTDHQSIKKGFDLGGVDYITKPFNGSELKARVKTHMELKRSKEALEEKNRALLESNRIKDKFFSIIAHDLKSPLNTFVSLTALMEENYEDFSEEERKDFLQTMSEHSRQLNKLLNNLLQWSMHQRGDMKVCPEELFLKSVIEENLKLYHQEIRRKKLRVETEVEPGLKVLGDPSMIQTIFRNLLSNAVKFTPNRGEIRIRGRLEQEVVLVDIKDTGVGIRKERIPHLFRLDQVNTTKGTNFQQGTGLGLILCREFVKFHKGEIEVDSQPDEGTKIQVKLPKKPVFSPEDLRENREDEENENTIGSF